MLLLLASCLCVLPMRAADLDGANQLYDQAKYPEAKDAYEKLVTAGEWSANLFYNLGNTNHRLGEPGEAMLDYRRALALDGSHPEAQANLSFLRNFTGAVPWPRSWMDAVFPQRWAHVLTIVGAFAGWVAIFAITALCLAARRSKLALWCAAVAGLSVASYAAVALWHIEQDRALAIITAKSVEARAAPAESSAASSVLVAGSEVRVLSVRGDWIYCALPGQGRGWIPAKALERVRLGSS
ncbi:MAG: hypothetical protein WCF18_04665 [Chthoniobacteraceae bacterium]